MAHNKHIKENLSPLEFEVEVFQRMMKLSHTFAKVILFRIMMRNLHSKWRIINYAYHIILLENLD